MLTRRLGRYRSDVSVQSSVFQGLQSTEGNFSRMINQKTHLFHLFIFNDNINQFQDAILHPHDHKYHTTGGGNATIRPHQPNGRAIGIPTGPRFNSLDTTYQLFGRKMSVKHIIDYAIQRIIMHLIQYTTIDTITYSANQDGLLGLGIFQHSTGQDVISYITQQIHSIPTLLKKARYVN